MDIFAVHFCPRCHNLQSLVGKTPTRLVCPTCGEVDIAPVTALFGRNEWDRSQHHPARMLAVLKEMGIDLTLRQMRLISCAAARTQLPATEDDKFQEAITLAEEWADTGIRPTGVVRVRWHLNVNANPRGSNSSPIWVRIGTRCLAEDATDLEVRSYPLPELLAPIYRDLIPNPFLPLAWNHDWFTSTVRDLAQHIYTAHDFGAMPVLADALQDASCDDEQILTHCRANRPHARGCWVLDAILGKS